MAAVEPGQLCHGVFVDGPIVGLRYATATLKGISDRSGTFDYHAGEDITFSIGTLELGRTAGAPRLSIADLAGLGDQTSLRHNAITNRARLVYSLSEEPDLRSGITISDQQAVATGAIASALDFDADVAEFASNAALVATWRDFGLRYRGAAEARNHLRRARLGIHLERDVEIPTRDGSYVSADVYRPTHGGAHPTLIRMSVYGKAFEQGSAVTDAQVQAMEDREDDWFETDRAGLSWYAKYCESAASPNTTDWVPRGYAMVRVDSRGVGKSPGELSPFSKQEAEDYYDAIQWCAQQPWSDGKVATFGASYNATNQWAVAAMQPPALRAMIPYVSDQDSYRELAYPGGIFLEKWRAWWFNEMVLTARPNGAGPARDFVAELKHHPFDDPAFYGPAGSGPLSADFAKVEVPVMTSISQTLMLHGRAGVEAFNQLRGPKYLLIVDATSTPYLFEDTLRDQQWFLDRYLKGIEPASEPPAVRTIIRKGNNQIEWREAASWPIPGTQYQHLYLSGASGTMGALCRLPVDQPASVTYSAENETTTPRPGAYFETAPLDQDLELAGHFTCRLWMSSSSTDADVYVALRTFDGEHEVLYPTREVQPKAPLTWGVLKASHRKTDPAKSTPERPWHTHTQADYAPLEPGEIVEVVVELFVATARVKAGQRLRVEISAIEGPGGMPGLTRYYDAGYHDGATNTVYCGGDRPSAIIIPVIPKT